jgi:hypothetical protein
LTRKDAYQQPDNAKTKDIHNSLVKLLVIYLFFFLFQVRLVPSKSILSSSSNDETMTRPIPLHPLPIDRIFRTIGGTEAEERCIYIAA